MPDIWSWLRKNYWAFPKGLFWSSVYVWIPIQVVNLYWVPLPFRVLYMNVSVMVRFLPCPRDPPSLSAAPPTRPFQDSTRVSQMWTVYLAAKLNREQAAFKFEPEPEAQTDGTRPTEPEPQTALKND